ncbi:MAG: glycoside hydrolase family 3 C-terminal domain-containing protein, partial [Oscillospiraceae bacterium]|nr:glycoside hydrolase family 3 C-terminal domain-containing protein [Oscillospiraceae bacterium]
GVNGLRGTIFPCPVNYGATFDPALVEQVGDAIAHETRSLGMHEILAPNLDVSRDPRWGRTEETFGEDTYLSCRMAEAIVSGEQKGDISRSDSVIAEPKHYCVHGIAEGGINCATARVGKREIESCYLPVFETAIKKGGAYNVMASYNSIDGDPVMASHYYLTEVLKDRIGLKGYSRSDWGGVGRLRHLHHVVSTDKDAIAMAITNGLDVQGCDFHPTFWKETVLELIREGRIPTERIDDICSRVLRVKFELGLFQNPYTDETNYKEIVRSEKHLAVSHKVAQESITLLKNDGVLPLKKDIGSIALIGPSSNMQKLGGYASLPQFPVPTVFSEMKRAAGDRVTICQCDGCAITEGEKRAWWVEGQPHLFSEGEDAIENNMDEAIRMAKHCDVIVAVCGDNSLTSGEGRDRCSLTLYGPQSELIERLAELNKPLILVLENGRQLELSRENELCNAVLMTWYGGETGAKAIVEALFGDFSPAGRLPLSLPSSSGSIPCYYSMLPGKYDSYMDGTTKPLYGFGHGLSYTAFQYSDLQICQGEGYDVTVSCKVENIGAVDSDEVVQLYLDDIDSSVVTPPMLLKGFERIHLKAGESKIVSFKLDYDSFKLMNPRYEWVVEPGDFRVLIGASSQDIRLEGKVTLQAK